eukprot:4444966-Amphidinium_carterae.1
MTSSHRSFVRPAGVSRLVPAPFNGSYRSVRWRINAYTDRVPPTVCSTVRNAFGFGLEEIILFQHHMSECLNGFFGGIRHGYRCEDIVNAIRDIFRCFDPIERWGLRLRNG